MESRPDVAAPVVVVPSDADIVVVTSKGGIVAVERDPTSDCWPTDNTFTLVRHSRELLWRSCETSQVPASEDGAPKLLAHFVENSVTLSEAAYVRLDEALQAVAVTTKDICAPDLPVLGLTVASPQGEVSYRDNVERCGRAGNYAEGLMLVLHRLDAVAGTSSYPYLLVGFEDPAGPMP